VVENKGFIENHQFGFNEKHSTIQQTRLILQRINEALENKRYSSTAFLDISQAFDKVMACWTLVQVKTVFPSESISVGIH
jgi:hypothetical protein